MIAIETDRLLLRNYKMTDLEDVIQYFSDEEVSKYENFYPMSEEQVRNIRICRYFTPFSEKCTHCLKFEVQYIDANNASAMPSRCFIPKEKAHVW